MKKKMVTMNIPWLPNSVIGFKPPQYFILVCFDDARFDSDRPMPDSFFFYFKGKLFDLPVVISPYRFSFCICWFRC